jgi:hypothetical protein
MRLALMMLTDKGLPWQRSSSSSHSVVNAALAAPW